MAGCSRLTGSGLFCSVRLVSCQSWAVTKAAGACLARSIAQNGGCDRHRTCNHLIANQELSQLSYAPMVPLRRIERHFPAFQTGTLSTMLQQHQKLAVLAGFEPAIYSVTGSRGWPDSSIGPHQNLGCLEGFEPSRRLTLEPQSSASAFSPQTPQRPSIRPSAIPGQPL